MIPQYIHTCLLTPSSMHGKAMSCHDLFERSSAMFINRIETDRSDRGDTCLGLRASESAMASLIQHDVRYDGADGIVQQRHPRSQVIMRLSSFVPIVALLQPLLVESKQHHAQVYLHPAPSTQSHFSPPVLSADEASAVLAHHYAAGESVSEFEPLPESSTGGRWVDLLEGTWEDAKEYVGGEERRPEDRARVIIIQGSVAPSCMHSNY
jgi:hypothetical protein